MRSLPATLPPLTVTPGTPGAATVAVDRPLRWGFLGTGRIAHGFGTALALLPDHDVAAVGSRRADTAAAFAGLHGGTAYDSYDAVLADPAVDVVYVATPHALHRANALAALGAGKPVLVEKPLTLDAAEAAEVVAAARGAGVFCMEAMWMRCNPLVRRLQQLLASGELGTVRQVHADLGFVVDRPATDRLLDPALGAGALLDMGIYPLTLAQLLLGAPDHVACAATLAETGIDLDVALALRYPGGALAALTASMTSWSPRTATVATELGRFELPAPFHHPEHLTWVSGARTETLTEPVIGGGLAHEAVEVARCLRAGETESPLVPLDDSLEMLRLMDRIRADIGVTYGAHR